MDTQKIAQDNLILKFRAGSHLYGTNGPNSDEDFMGVFMPTKELMLGLSTVDQVEFRTNSTGSGKANTKEDTDYTVYSLPKFIKLLLNNNPNIIELLYAPENCILFCNEFGQKLLDNRDLFLSLRVKNRFLGYAYSQKHKMQSQTRIGSRKANFEEFGYDTKFASHLMRLMYFGLELLKEGQLTLPTEHNNYLRDIKEGKFSLQEILEKATQVEQLVEMAYASSTLQKIPDWDAVEKLQIEMLLNSWSYE